MPPTADTSPHLPCSRCQTTEPEAFTSPTSAFCDPCWQAIIDPSEQFHRWADGVRFGSRRGPFFIGRGRS